MSDTRFGEFQVEVEDRWDSESPGICKYTFKLDRRRYRSDLSEEFSFTRG